MLFYYTMLCEKMVSHVLKGAVHGKENMIQ